MDPSVGIVDASSVQGYMIQFLSMTKASKVKFSTGEFLRLEKEEVGVAVVAGGSTLLAPVPVPENQFQFKKINTSGTERKHEAGPEGNNVSKEETNEAEMSSRRKLVLMDSDSD